MLLSSIFNLLQHPNQVTDLVNHAANFGRIDQFACAIQFAQSQTTHGCAMGLLAANWATHQLDLYGLLCSHFQIPDQAKSSSTVLPRLAATLAGVVDTDNASSVARTML